MYDFNYFTPSVVTYLSSR